MNKLLTCLALSALLAPITLSAKISEKYDYVLMYIKNANEIQKFAPIPRITKEIVVNKEIADTLVDIIASIARTNVLDKEVNKKLLDMVARIRTEMDRAANRALQLRELQPAE